MGDDADAIQRVVVVHGVNHAIRDALMALLYAYGLEPVASPVVGRSAPDCLQSIAESTAALAAGAAAVVVLLTPDDLVYPEPSYSHYVLSHSPSGQSQHQPLGTLLFEAGALVALAPAVTILAKVGELPTLSTELPKDTIALDNSERCRVELADKLAAVGCVIRRDAARWTGIGDFSLPEASDHAPNAPSSTQTRHETPRLTGDWIPEAEPSLDHLRITNSGTGTVFDVLAEIPDEVSGVDIWQAGPLPVLPPGATFTLRAYGRAGPDRFTIRLKGRSAAGAEIVGHVFVDTVGRGR